jgi:hypothetical protein
VVLNFESVDCCTAPLHPRTRRAAAHWRPQRKLARGPPKIPCASKFLTRPKEEDLPPLIGPVELAWAWFWVCVASKHSLRRAHLAGDGDEGQSKPRSERIQSKVKPEHSFELFDENYSRCSFLPLVKCFDDYLNLLKSADAELRRSKQEAEHQRREKNPSFSGVKTHGLRSSRTQDDSGFQPGRHQGRLLDRQS